MSQPLTAITGVYVLLADGTTIQIRSAASSDFEAVKAMHEAMSPGNAYLRFFSLSRTAAEREARRICRAPGPEHAALLALYGAEVVGVASYEVASYEVAGDATEDADVAEVAFAVADSMHHRGIATLLLEHLVSIARGRGIRAFTAEALSENADMLRVFAAAGLPARSMREDGVVTITIPLPPDDTGKELDEYLDTVALRERSANVASLRPVFDPKSVAVVGSSRRQGTVGRSVLDNIRSCGYQGRLYAVNPHAVNPHTPQIGGVVSGPVDTTATVSREQFRQVLELLSADEDVDAMIALVLPTAATGDLVAAISDAAVTVPFAAVVLHQPEAVRLLDSPGGKIPAYGYPEAAAAALARAAKYGQWRSRPHDRVPRFPDLTGPAVAEARALARAFLAKSPDGGWLPPDQVAALLRGYGIPLPATAEARNADTTAAGIELIIRVEDDQVFGPLVVFGLGGVATEVLADRAARLAPLTEPDADTLINSIRSAPLLHGHRGAPAADLAALRDVLMRVSRLADDLPEITDLDLNPVIARPDGVVAAGARIKVAPQSPQDHFLRRLR